MFHHRVPADLLQLSAQYRPANIYRRDCQIVSGQIVQIAGLVARRILCWVEEGESLKTGERFGLIRFGSRVDIYLPDGIAPKVAVGQQVLGGETIMADLADTDNQIQRVADPI